MALHSFDLASETKNQGGTALCYLFGKAFTLAWSEFSNFLVMCTPWCGANWWFEKLTRDMLCTRTLERSRLWKHRKCLRWGTACLLWHWPSIITEGVAWDTTTKDTHCEPSWLCMRRSSGPLPPPTQKSFIVGSHGD